MRHTNLELLQNYFPNIFDHPPNPDDATPIRCTRCTFELTPDHKLREFALHARTHVFEEETPEQ